MIHVASHPSQHVYVLFGVGRLTDFGAGAAVESDVPGGPAYLRSLHAIDNSEFKNGDTWRLNGVDKDEFDDDDAKRRLHAVDPDEIKEEDADRRRLSSCAHLPLWSHLCNSCA